MRDPIHFAQRHRIHVEFDGEFVHDALDGKRCLGASRSTDGIGWRGVGEDADAVEVIHVHLVDTRVHEHPQQRCAGRDDLQVGPHIGQDFDLQADELAILRGGDLDLLDLVPSVVRGDHVFAARLHPLHGATQLAGNLDSENLLAVDLEFAAKSTADVGSDHPQGVLRQAGHEGEEHTQNVWNLRRRPDGHLVAHAHGRRNNGSRLHGTGDDALVDVAALDDHHIVSRGRHGCLVGSRPLGLQGEGVAHVGPVAAVCGIVHAG